MTKHHAYKHSYSMSISQILLARRHIPFFGMPLSPCFLVRTYRCFYVCRQLALQDQRVIQCRAGHFSQMLDLPAKMVA